MEETKLYKLIYGYIHGIDMVVMHYATQNNIEYMKDNTVKFIQDVAKTIDDENKKEK